MATTTNTEAARSQARAEWERSLDELLEAAEAWSAHLDALHARQASGAFLGTEGNALVLRTRVLNAASHYGAAIQMRRKLGVRL